MSTFTNKCFYFSVAQFERHVTRHSGSKQKDTTQDDEIMVIHVEPGPSPAKKQMSTVKPHPTPVKQGPKCKCKLVHKLQSIWRLKYAFYGYNF